MIAKVPNTTKPDPTASSAVPDAGDGTLRMGSMPVPSPTATARVAPGASPTASSAESDAGDGTLRMSAPPVMVSPTATAVVPDGPAASPVASPVATAAVPDGPAASRAASPLATAFVPDGPDSTRIVPDGPDVTRAVPDGPTATRDLRGSTGGSLPRFGRFAATAELGAGGMGTVFRARDEVLGRDVAIKALHAQGDLGIRERFIREARAIGAVLHPHILAVYDAGDAAGTPFLVMELAGGGSLRDRMQAGPLPADAVRELGIQIARALAAAHAAKIIHRDVKPGNILCAQPGTWKLADFGIARVPDSTLTITGQFLGSPSYAAPESLRAGECSPASDVYSLGVTLYEALAGAPPHGDHDMKSIVRKLEHDAPPLPASLNIPGPLGAAIMAALARDPAQRPTAEHLAQRLAQTGDAVMRAPGAAAAGAQHAVMGVPGAAGAQHAVMGAAGAQPAVMGVSGAAGAQAAAVPGASAAPAVRAGSHRMKLLAAALAAIAIVAIVLAVKSKSEPAVQVPGVTRPIEGAREGANDGTRDGTRAPDETAEDGERVAPGGGWDDRIEPPEPPEPPRPPGMPDEAAAPIYVDQYGNQVDEETAKQMLEQMERDARSSVGRGRGRKKFKD